METVKTAEFLVSIPMSDAKRILRVLEAATMGSRDLDHLPDVGRMTRDLDEAHKIMQKCYGDAAVEINRLDNALKVDKIRSEVDERLANQETLYACLGCEEDFEMLRLPVFVAGSTVCGSKGYCPDCYETRVRSSVKSSEEARLEHEEEHGPLF